MSGPPSWILGGLNTSSVRLFCFFLNFCPSSYLDAVLHLHVSQQFAVDAEEAEVALVVVDHAVPLSGRLDEAGPRAALGSLQGAQQVAVHGVDQTGTLWTNITSQRRLKLADCQRLDGQIFVMRGCFEFCFSGCC